MHPAIFKMVSATWKRFFFFICNGQAKKCTENYEIHTIMVNNTKDQSHCPKSNLASQYLDSSEEHRRDSQWSRWSLSNSSPESQSGQVESVKIPKRWGCIVDPPPRSAPW